MKKPLWQRGVAVVAAAALILNSFGSTALLVFAQEASSSATLAEPVQPSTTPESLVAPSPTSEPTPDIAQTQTATPSSTPTPTESGPTPPPLQPTPPPATSDVAPAVGPTPSPTPTLSPALVATKSSTLEGDFVEGEVIVKYKEQEIDLETGTGQKEAETFQGQHQLAEKDEIEDLNMQVLASQDKSTGQIIAELADKPEVERVEPNFIRRASVIPNDTSFANLWGLHNTGQSVDGVSGTPDADIDAPEAWDVESASQEDVLVAVLDTGVLHTHPDLAANMWDGSSCKDENGDTIVGGCPNHGWDFINNDNDPIDDNGHGTHVAGTIAAVSNNSTGVSGVSIANNIKIMAVKFLDADGFGTLAGEIKAINFARHNGARVVNASFGGGSFARSEKETVDAFSGTFVASAGNDRFDNDSDLSTANYPCSYNSVHIVCVAATDQNDELALFSNYGASSVDVGAPGVNIYSTVLNDGYDFFDGTSMATPHVAGLAALVLSSDPNLSAAQIKVIILDSGDSKESLVGNTTSGRRINAFSALEQMGQQAPIVVINEFFVNGTGEWVELYNPGNEEVNLTGWVLDDNGGSATTHTIGEDSSTTKIGPGKFLVVEDNFGFNDASPFDTVRLIDPDGEVVDSHQYASDPGTSSIGRNPDGGQNFQIFTNPTPGINNGSRFDTIYVDDDWTDSGNDGGYFWGLNAFSTIGAGINVVGLGGTVNVASGLYEGPIDIEKNLRLIGPGLDTEERAQILSYCDWVLNITVNDVTVKGFVLADDEYNQCYPLIRVDSGVSGLVVTENEIFGGYRGINFRADATGNTVSNNLIHDNSTGISLTGSYENTISGNEIYYNGEGILLRSDGGGDVGGNIITDNYIHDNEEDGIRGDSGIFFSELTITGNDITENEGYGIYFNEVFDAILTISENDIRGNGSTGIYLSGGGNSVDNSNVAISNNTISTNQSDGIYADVITASTFEVLNNIIEENDGNGVYVCAEGECTDSTVTINGNAISGNESNGLYLYNILSSTVAIDDNDIVSNNEKGISMQYIGASAPSDPSTVTLADNTISGNSFDGIYLGDVDEVSQVEIGSGNTIAANSSSGIYLDSGVTGVLITGNTIESHSPESQNIGIAVRSATGNQAHQNVISGNGVGVENQDGDEGDFFDAAENYWGHATGPLDEELNPQGQGDRISGGVLFAPFYSDQDLTKLESLDIDLDDIASFVENGIFDLPDDEEGEALVEFLTILQELEFDFSEGGGETDVVLPAGLRIERSDDQEFAWADLKLQDIAESALSGFTTDEVIEEAIQWGLPGIELEFSQPITISIFVGTTLNGQTLNVKRSTSGSSGWTNSGIVAPAICVVSSGLCSFQATKASFFAATSTPAPTPTPTPPTTSGGGGGGGGSGAATAPSCGDGKPGSAPKLTSATPSVNSVTLTWEEANDPLTYYLIAYGTKPGTLQFGNPNIGGKGTKSFTVSDLSGGVRYYFRVRGGNGCMPGDYSNELSATPRGRVIAQTPASGFAEGVLGGTKDIKKEQESKASQPVITQPKEQKPAQNVGSVISNFFRTIVSYISALFTRR